MLKIWGKNQKWKAERQIIRPQQNQKKMVKKSLLHSYQKSTKTPTFLPKKRTKNGYIFTKKIAEQI